MKEVLMEALKVGARLEAEGENLRVISAPGALSLELQQRLRTHKAEIIRYLRDQDRPAAADDALVADRERIGEPFPLTDLQHAYWMGRDSAIELGGISTHWYTEMEYPELDLPRLNRAFNRLVRRHDMLRAVILPTGMQRILPEVPDYAIRVTDLADAPEAERERALLSAREELSHQMFRPDAWPLFEIRAYRLPGAKVRLHVSIDLIILDAMSISTLFSEWFRLYRDPDAALPPLEASFRDHVLRLKALEKGPAHEAAKAYWMGRLDRLPPAPSLPVHGGAALRAKPRFSRRNAVLDRDRWASLRAEAGRRGITPTSLLLAAYGEVLARWSAKPRFTLNMIVAHRGQAHADLPGLLGVFTSVNLQEVDRSEPGQSFRDFALALQKQTAQDLQHRSFSGVNVIRELGRRQGTALHASMPVVFNSTLAGGPGETMDRGNFGTPVFSQAQTSQVYLENHCSEHGGELHFHWDAIDAVFLPGTLDAMFSAYAASLERLAADPAAWDGSSPAELPAPMAALRAAANDTAAELHASALHAGFVANARQNPDAPAVLGPVRNLAYGELLAESAAVADWLRSRGIAPGQPVAVMMRKGWEQIVAVFGVLLAGAAYMPVNADLPLKRRKELVAIGGSPVILTQPGIDTAAFGAGDGALPEGAILEILPHRRAEFGPLDEASLSCPPDSLAYVIFTSGTTGVPKGVMIDHRGAVNTILHVNRMFQVGAEDRALGVSSLSFDLSVYDIFGLLAAGGALVLPDSRKGHDAGHWQELIAEHGVTLWNSAPQLLNMLVDASDPKAGGLASLRTVMLSGDFIPLDLPDRVRALAPRAKVFSLGGATEASIWSNWHPVARVEEGWKSIPYGRPLPNQTMWVLDHALRPCPDHVVGRIHIGGIGLAIGYWGDAALTAARFITHPATGERLYDTGDLGQYAANGDIIILGRADRQVKIRGYRVELDEIESVLNAHPAVKQALVAAQAGPNRQNRLAAYVVPAGAPPATADLKAFLSERLPEYMVPPTFSFLETLPISANGKVDYKALQAPSEEGAAEGGAPAAPRTETENLILAIWARVLNNPRLGVGDSFFEVGGDSITAANLLREMNTALSLKLEMHEFLENFTVESLAKVADGKRAAAPVRAETQPVARVLEAAARETVESFRGLAFGPPAGDPAKPAAVLLSGATGWLGRRVLGELLSATEAEVHCLVRNRPGWTPADLLGTLSADGIPLPADAGERVRIAHGDLAAPGLGLDPAARRELADRIDSIYHLGANLNLLFDFQALRKANSEATADLIRFAAEGRRKALFFASPMAVCMRLAAGRVTAFTREAPLLEAEGMLTGYAQSKWLSEAMIVGACGLGLSARIYRCSHALPDARSGRAKPGDTFMSVLALAGRAGSVPEWDHARMHGLPADELARLLVADSLRGDGHVGVVHLDNPKPPRFSEVLRALLAARGAASAATVPFARWQEDCARAADALPDGEHALAKALVAPPPGAHAPIEHMFGSHHVGMDRLPRFRPSGQAAGEDSLGYWETVFRGPEWTSP
jgi:pyochelin synthetase